MTPARPVQARRAPFNPGAHRIGLLCVCTLGTWVNLARGQQCPAEFSACDNGGCCLSSEQCCPEAADGCCSSYAPYCCGDGSCAASPGQCDGKPKCQDYDLPCGEGCAPAGSQCCDDEGHYCEPESTCTSTTTCVLGSTPALALRVVAVPVPGAAPPPLRSPLKDPTDASARSCSVALGGDTTSHALPFAAWCLVAAWLRRRCSRAPARA
jgi:hypothetical protein